MVKVGGKESRIAIGERWQLSSLPVLLKLGLGRTSASALTQSGIKPLAFVSLPTSCAFPIIFTWETLTVISCNIKHYCPTRCARDFIIIAEHQNVGTLADLLLRYLGVSVSSVCVTCVTEAQYLLLSVDVQRKERSAVGSIFTWSFLSVGCLRHSGAFFSLIRVSMQKTDLVKCWCTVSPCSIFITHSCLAWKLTRSAGCFGKADCFHLQRGLQQSAFKMTL